ncbi:hypothetical protein [Pseudonocardia adelaidensis]|uniref:Uncharacterized protein n=1 Tax=Pseudonocardia adelaidensis TaxID=648754 RepID=A0ABP9NLP5_9PSEU
MLASALGRAPAAAGTIDIAAVAARVVDVVSRHRATWTVYHVRRDDEARSHSLAMMTTRRHD